jgi:hypothetical protein
MRQHDQTTLLSRGRLVGLYLAGTVSVLAAMAHGFGGL